ncbi:hypothetical protein Prum_060280 [Phytohabitans rumicis]|uniref:Carbohydrate kinase PfkB domain-containing protein n=1 Tax=Phytohabitans rumicis TaxID=1076125 RepID=A0A6V8LE65_9ACTN|nr:hypothetical protein Prum_060280 [Phytohabitans rumicis]
MRMIDVITLGETMAALRAGGPLRLGGTLALSVAGAEANVAIGLSRLGHAVRWVGVTGADELGELVLRTLRAEGVDVSACAVDPHAPTGLIIFEPRVAGVTRVSYYRTGSAGSRLSEAEVDVAFAAGPRGCCTSPGSRPRSAPGRPPPWPAPSSAPAPPGRPSAWTSTTAPGCGRSRTPPPRCARCCPVWTSWWRPTTSCPCWPARIR